MDEVAVAIAPDALLGCRKYWTLDHHQSRCEVGGIVSPVAADDCRGTSPFVSAEMVGVRLFSHSLALALPLPGDGNR